MTFLSPYLLSLQNRKKLLRNILLFCISVFGAFFLVFASSISFDFENKQVLVKQAPIKEKFLELEIQNMSTNPNNISWTFKSKERNMAGVAVEVDTSGIAVFRIKEKGHDLYYQNGLDLDKFRIDRFFSFDFPLIASSAGKTFVLTADYPLESNLAASEFKPSIMEINKYSYGNFFNEQGGSKGLIQKLSSYVNGNNIVKLFFGSWIMIGLFHFLVKSSKNRYLFIVPLFTFLAVSLFIAMKGFVHQFLLIIGLWIYLIISLRLRSNHSFIVALIYFILGIFLFLFNKSPISGKVSLLAYAFLVIGSFQFFVELIQVKKMKSKPILPISFQKKYINFGLITRISKIVPWKKLEGVKIEKYLFIFDVLFIIIIILAVQWFVDFRWGQYLFTGDFRFNVHNSIIGNSYLHLISGQFSSNNFIYLTFYSFFSVFQFVPYQYMVLYLIFGLPILLFLSMKYVLLKMVNFKNSWIIYFLASSVALYYSLNPSIFLRYVHWTILHSNMLLPIYILLLYGVLRKKKIFTPSLMLLPVVLYFGAMVPQGVVIYAIATFFLYISVYLLSGPAFKKYLLKGILLFSVYILSFAHVLFPILIGYGQTKSSLESPTKSYFLSYFSRNSNILTAVSGTNFYDPLINYAFPFSVGLLMFIMTIAFFAFTKSKNRINFVLLLFSLIMLIVLTGYRTFSGIFDFLNATYVSHFLWLIKDPNMYYLVFLMLLSFLFVRVVVFSNVSKIFIFLLSILLITLNILFILGSKTKSFNEDFQFVKVPNEYFAVSDLLSKDSGRNFWYPNDTYVSKNFSKNVVCFPTPPLWLTENKELFGYLVSDYKKLSKTISEEIYDKNCKNVNFLDWIISAHSLNVILDRNSVDNKNCPKDNTEDKIKQATLCMSKLKYVYKYKTEGNIDIYKSKLPIKKEVYLHEGNIETLDSFLKKNPVNVVYLPKNEEKSEKLPLSEFTILNESFDKNWEDENNNQPIYRVNLGSMVFKGENHKFSYREEDSFQKLVLGQKSILAIFGLLSIIFYIKQKKHDKKSL